MTWTGAQQLHAASTACDVSLCCMRLCVSPRAPIRVAVYNSFTCMLCCHRGDHAVCCISPTSIPSSSGPPHVRTPF
jgi:hypothetical protein